MRLVPTNDLMYRPSGMFTGLNHIWHLASNDPDNFTCTPAQNAQNMCSRVSAPMGLQPTGITGCSVRILVTSSYGHIVKEATNSYNNNRIYERMCPIAWNVRFPGSKNSRFMNCREQRPFLIFDIWAVHIIMNSV